jgi:pyridoxine kinase
MTVALPIISACGIETCVLPSAVLSTHTAGFKGFTFRDLTSDLESIAKHWQDQNIGFDALYTGYLGSFDQLNIVDKIFKDFKTKENLILIDPVMADNGKLYPGFDQKFADAMAKLCKNADIIVPNLTEASFMLHTPYVESGYTEDYIKDILKKLTDLGAKKALLTGVSFSPDKLGVYGYDKETGEYFTYFREQLPCKFHGTGDIFASTLCGALASGKDFNSAIQIAVAFTVQSIIETSKNPDHNWYGVEFENAFPYLIERIK